MITMDFHSELQALLSAEATTDDVIRRNIIKEVIYKEANLLAVGTKVMPTRQLSELDIKMNYPEDMAADYPVPEGAPGIRAEAPVWVEYDLSLPKGRTRWVITDEAKMRQLSNYQMEFTRRKASEALAIKKDAEILDVINTGAGQTVTVAGGYEWDAASAAPEDDIIDAISAILDNSNINETQIKGMDILVPTAVFGQLMKLQEIRNIKQSIMDFFEGGYKMKFHPTRYYTDNAYVTVNSPQTCVHFELSTNKIPLVEQDRIKGVGDEYIITQYFKTKVVPESSSQTTSNRICKIANVAA